MAERISLDDSEHLGFRWGMERRSDGRDGSVDPDFVWAKLARAPDGRVILSQSLDDHSLDVAAVFAALLDVPGISRRLASLAKATTLELDRRVRVFLYWLVFMHDFGKVNAGFQARREQAAAPIGHVAPIVALFQSGPFNRELREAADLALGLDRLETWGEIAFDLLHATLSHHGKPWASRVDDNIVASYTPCWRHRDGYDPIKALAKLRSRADEVYPAFGAAAHDLPNENRFVHAFAGLVQLADWIGSSDWELRSALGDSVDRKAWAATRLADIGISANDARRRLVETKPTFESAFGFHPRTLQANFANLPGSLAILESETGSGKTEASLWRFVERFKAGAVDGLFFALPTRSAAVQLFHRVETLARRLWGDDCPTVILAVPGYLDDEGAGALPYATDRLDLPERDMRMRSVWATEHPKRYFAATISVGTIDQALLSALRVKHAHMRGALLMRLMLVVDEVHASDAYMRRLLEYLLRDHLTAGGEAMLLSATLGAEARTRFMKAAGGTDGTASRTLSLTEAAATSYPLMTTPQGQAVGDPDFKGRIKAVAMEAVSAIEDPIAIARCALEAARLGAKVLVVRNTVDGAVAVANALAAATKNANRELLFQVKGAATLHHGRFAREDRKLLDSAVEAAFGKSRPAGGLVLVGTQTLEQSLDIDADLLVTDLCPADVLLQRIGRLHRHERDGAGAPRMRPPGFVAPRAVVLTPNRPLADYMTGGGRGRFRRHGLGPRLKEGRLSGIYPNLLVLEATRRLIHNHTTWIIPKMNRALVENAIHSEAIEALIDSLDLADREMWRGHLSEVTGTEHGDRLTAELGCLDRQKPFMADCNAIGAGDERLMTRLGDEGLLVDLPSGTMGPFAATISRLVIPAWMVSKGDAPVVVEPAPGGGLEIQAGGNAFLYNNLGLLLRS